MKNKWENGETWANPENYSKDPQSQLNQPSEVATIGRWCIKMGWWTTSEWFHCHMINDTSGDIEMG